MWLTLFLFLGIFCPLSVVNGQTSSSRDTICGYRVCRPEIIVQFSDKSWMAIERPHQVTGNGSQAHVSQWFHWKNNQTPYLFMNPTRLPRVIDFFPDITSEVISSGFRIGNKLVLTAEFKQPEHSGGFSRDVVFEYEINGRPGFFTLMNKSSIFEYFPHLKSLEEVNGWMFHRILATTFIPAARLKDQRIIVRSWHAARIPYNPDIMVEARLLLDKSVDEITRLPPATNNSNEVQEELDSITYLLNDQGSDSQEQTFLVSSNGLWSRVKDSSNMNLLQDQGDIDAITDIEEGIAIFKNQHYWILPSLGPNSTLSPPRLIANTWSSFVGFLDAAVNVAIGTERRLLFFRGDKVYYCHISGDCYRTFFISYAFPGMTTVDAVYADPESRQLFLIKGDEVTVYEHIIEGYPAKQVSPSQSVLDVFPSFPERIDDAYFSDGTIYLFSQGFYLDSKETTQPVLVPYNLYSCDTNYTAEAAWKLLSVTNREDFETMRNSSLPILLERAASDDPQIMKRTDYSASTSGAAFPWIVGLVSVFLIFITSGLYIRARIHKQRKEAEEDMFDLEQHRY